MRATTLSGMRKAASAIVLASAVALATPAAAQQSEAVRGSPTATTTIDGRYLPPPPQKFEGVINPNADVIGQHE